MRNKDFLNNIFLVFTIISISFMFSGYSSKYLANLGQSAYERKDYLYAVSYFKGIINQNPNDTEAYFWLGKSYFAAGDAIRAIDCFNKVIGTDNAVSDTVKKDTYVTLAKAYYNYKIGDNEKALEAYKKANEIASGTDLENLSTFVDIYDKTDRITDAINLQKRFNPSDELLSRHYRTLSYLYNRNHNYDEAIKIGLKAIDAYPDNEMAYYMVGVAACQKGQYEKGIDAIRKALKMKSQFGSMENFPMNVNLAYFLAKNGQYNEAIAAYNQSIQVARNITTTYNSFLTVLALSYYNVGKYDEALFTINKIVQSLEKGKVGLFFRNSNSNIAYYIFDTVKNSPAEKAGLQYGDKIIEVNNVPAKKLSINQITETLSGIPGTQVTLKIKRDGKFTKVKKEIFNVNLTRENLNSRKQNKELASAYGIRSLIYRAKDDIKNSIEDAEKAYVLCPEAVNARIAYGLAKIENGNYLTAIDILSAIHPRMIESDRLYDFSGYYFFIPFVSDEEQLNLAKAIAYAKLDKIDKAVEFIPDGNQSLQLPPLANDYKKLSTVLEEISKVHEETAVNFEKNGNLDSALDEYTIAIALNIDENKNTAIKNNILNIVKQMPTLPPLTKEARTHMVRAEALL
ncbi:MAG: tetratricopeptide repeat protein, partial [Candidatus Gastranaerophilaceae bacterium]